MDQYGNKHISQLAGEVELLAGDTAAAERVLRVGYETLEAMGESGYLSSVVALPAQALYAEGREEEAETLTQTSEALASHDDLAAHMRWRGVGAKVLARRGEFKVAEKLGREAVALAEQTDFLNRHADMLMDLAEPLRQRDDEAIPVIEKALHLYEKKGNLVSSSRARARVGAT